MKASRVTDGIYRLSANGGSEILFESMWPLANGVAMNSYIVKGKECAIIDGVCGWDGAHETLFSQLEEIEIDERHRMKWDFLEPYEFAGAPKEKDLEVLRERGRTLAAAVKQMCSGNATAQAGEESRVAIAQV